MGSEAAEKEQTASKPKPEHRWAVFISIAFALTLYFFIPQKDQPIPRWIVPTIGALFLIPQVVLNPTRLVNERAWSRWMSVTLAAIMVLVNQVTIVLVLRDLIIGDSTGPAVLLTA